MSRLLLLAALLLAGCTPPPIEACAVFPPESESRSDEVLGLEFAWDSLEPDADAWGFERHDGTPADAAHAVLRCHARGAQIVVGPLGPGLAGPELERVATSDLVLLIPQADSAPPSGWPPRAASIAPPPATLALAAPDATVVTASDFGRSMAALSRGPLIQLPAAPEHWTSLPPGPALLVATPEQAAAALPHRAGRTWLANTAFGPAIEPHLAGGDVWGIGGPPAPDELATGFAHRWDRPATPRVAAAYEALRLAIWLRDQDGPLAERWLRLLDGDAGSLHEPSGWTVTGGVRHQTSTGWVSGPLVLGPDGLEIRPTP